MRQILLAELPELVGQELGVSDWVTVDQERVDRFAQATGITNGFTSMLSARPPNSAGPSPTAT